MTGEGESLGRSTSSTNESQGTLSTGLHSSSRRAGHLTSLGSGSVRPVSAAKVDELFIHWLSLPDTHSLLKGLVKGVTRGAISQADLEAVAQAGAVIPPPSSSSSSSASTTYSSSASSHHNNSHHSVSHMPSASPDSPVDEPDQQAQPIAAIVSALADALSSQSSLTSPNLHAPHVGAAHPAHAHRPKSPRSPRSSPAVMAAAAAAASSVPSPTFDPSTAPHTDSHHHHHNLSHDGEDGHSSSMLSPLSPNTARAIHATPPLSPKSATRSRQAAVPLGGDPVPHLHSPFNPAAAGLSPSDAARVGESPLDPPPPPPSIAITNADMIDRSGTPPRSPRSPSSPRSPRFSSAKAPPIDPELAPVLRPTLSPAAAAAAAAAVGGELSTDVPAPMDGIASHDNALTDDSSRGGDSVMSEVETPSRLKSPGLSRKRAADESGADNSRQKRHETSPSAATGQSLDNGVGDPPPDDVTAAAVAAVAASAAAAAAAVTHMNSPSSVDIPVDESASNPEPEMKLDTSDAGGEGSAPPPGVPASAPVLMNRANGEQILVKPGMAASIPQFFFPNGKPMAATQIEEEDRKISEVFAGAGAGGLTQADFVPVTKLVCGFPSFFNAPLFARIAGVEPEVGADGVQTPALALEGTTVSEEAFKSWWDENMKGMDTQRRFFNVIKQPGASEITPADLVPVIQQLLLLHPGLEFLHQTPEFQERYAETVNIRIFYRLNRGQRASISFQEFRRSNLVDVLNAVDDERDINKMTEYFSYEHFYVLYCKFWELDTDRDHLIDKEDLLRYANHSLTYRIVDRIFAQAPRMFVSGVEGKMCYEDFIWFCLSEEDKTNETSMEYWFRAIDMDGDGLISTFEMEYFYEEQLHRMECLNLETVNFEDILCQILDMLKPSQTGAITLADLRRSKMSGVFFNVLFNLNKFVAYEQRDPFLIHQEHAHPTLTEWDRWAMIEYERLAMEETGEESGDGDGESWNMELGGEDPVYQS